MQVVISYCGILRKETKCRSIEDIKHKSHKWIRSVSNHLYNSRKFFVSGSYDNKAIIWFMNQSDSCLTIDKHKAMISGVIYQSQKNTLYLSSLDKTISIWKLGFDSD